jgi:creatinine amidohydrolase
MTVQLELMRPEQLDAARDRFPVAYIPLGALEFHGRHLPVGLDTVKCHRMLIRMAEQLGGLVVPPIFYGHGSGHIGFPWTWMLDEPDTLKRLLLTTMAGLDANGIKVIVLMSGHYPNESIMTDSSAAFASAGGKAKVLCLMEYNAFETDKEWHGDHAAKWETSYMRALGDDLVDMPRLSVSPDGTRLDQVPTPKPPKPGGWWFEKNRSHPWYGLAAFEGNNPSTASVELGEQAIAAIIAWAGAKITTALDDSGWKRC